MDIVYSIAESRISLMQCLIFIPLAMILLLSNYMTKTVSVSLLLLSIFTALWFANLSLSAFVSIAVFITLAYYRQSHHQAISSYLKVALDLALFIFACAYMLHLVDGFDNQKIIDDLIISDGAPPYSQYLNLDKALLAVIFLLWLLPKQSALTWQNTRSMLLSASAVTCAVIVLALISGLVAFEPKLSLLIIPWAVVNLLFTCFAEELLFRGLIQVRLNHILQHCCVHPLIKSNYYN